MEKSIFSSLVISFFLIGISGFANAIPTSLELDSTATLHGVFSSDGDWFEVIPATQENLIWDVHPENDLGKEIIKDLSRIFNINSFIIEADDNDVFSMPSAIEHYFSSPKNRAYGAPVPEPATMLLFGIGLTGLSRISRKKELPG